MYLMYAIETNGTSFCFSYLRNILDKEKQEKSQLVFVYCKDSILTVSCNIENNIVQSLYRDLSLLGMNMMKTYISI